CGGVTGNAWFFDLPGEGQWVTFPAHNNEVKGVAISADGTRGLSVGGDQAVRMWDLTKAPAAVKTASGAPPSAPLPADKNGALQAWAFNRIPRAGGMSQDGRRGLFALDKELVVADLEGWKEIKRLPLGPDELAPNVLLTKDGRQAVVGEGQVAR